jgi:hypothetical protein
MDLTAHKQTQQMCADKARYFTNIDFPNLAANFQQAADAMAELIAALEKIESDGQ